jgi:uncharacterized OB-fold protein
MPGATAPKPADDEAFFWEGARKGRLLLQRCGACKAFCHPPLPMCPYCQSLHREIVESTGRGSVYSWIRSRHPSDPGSESRIAALVQLEEGVRLVANLCEFGDVEVQNDMPVEVVFVETDGLVVPSFRPNRPEAG